jgi:hypothetical protein
MSTGCCKLKTKQNVNIQLQTKHDSSTQNNNDTGHSPQ